MSAWRRRARQNLVTDVAESKATDVLDGMSWREFEMLVGEGFRLQGYQVVETGGGGADGGVDLVLTKPGKNGGEKFLVQCKQWRAFKVGVDVVRELYGVMAARGATGVPWADLGTARVMRLSRANMTMLVHANGRQTRSLVMIHILNDWLMFNSLSLSEPPLWPLGLAALCASAMILSRRTGD